MNAVEIEEAVAQLAIESFDATEFPFSFLAAFDNKPATIARLRAGATNASDVRGGVLQRNHIHLATCVPGMVTETLAALRASPKTVKARAKYVLATDGEQIEAHDLVSDEPLACPFRKLAEHFGFFLPLAGITTVQEIKDNPIDIKATGRLFKLYVQLLNDNPEWATEARRHDLNQFMARLIFCFFAEDTGIFFGNGLFSQTIAQMSDATNTHEVIGEVFRAMDIPIEDRDEENLRSWADVFPFVNGGLFTGTRDTPVFSRMGRAYLLSVGELDWKHINPDIFGSMIQGIADEDERGSLGMHYTSVPNILKVLDPLFLDDLRESLRDAGDNARKLLNLRKRIASIRVFDPACGSGNFLVIAYIKMREIEAEIIRRRNDDKKSWITLTNFYGIEIKDFACETARLSLLIAEFQCDARLIGQREACLNILPLKKTGRIECGNALRLAWSAVCPPVVGLEEHDLAGQTGRLALESAGESVVVETYICGNPPYKGAQTQSDEQKADLESLLDGRIESWRTLDYVSGWFVKATDYAANTKAACAFVSTNSICQGRSVPVLWPAIFASGQVIAFAHTSFKWTNLASHNAGVTVVVVGLSADQSRKAYLFEEGDDGLTARREVSFINAYLVPGANVIVQKRSSPFSGLGIMDFGNMPADGGNLLLDASAANDLGLSRAERARFLRRVYGSAEFIRGLERWSLWIDDADRSDAEQVPTIAARIEKTRQMRLGSKDSGTRALASQPHQFRERKHGKTHTIVVPSVSSEARPYLPVGLVDGSSVLTNLAFGLYDAPLWNFALVASRVHLVWVATVCGKLKTDFRYSNTLGWNTFPVPAMTTSNKAELSACAEEILLAREAHFPATIAELYDVSAMPENLRIAHEKNDEVLERVYVGRRFRNDTERLEKLFELYVRLAARSNNGEAAE